MESRAIVRDHDGAVVIVHYRPGTEYYNGGNAPQNPACLLQVTLLQSKISPSGNLIRLGDTRGDEITGWTKLDALEVLEILGELSEDGQSVNPIQLEAKNSVLTRAA